ncbi:MAG: hypothetical protein ACRD04_06665 [Terriglobales bacterium]
MSASNDCERAAELLPELWNQELEAPGRAADRLWLRQHLEGCAGCAGLAQVWQRLGALPEAAPAPAQRARFLHMLDAFEQGMAAAPKPAAWLRWLPMPQPALALAALLIAGLVGGWFLRGARAPAASTSAELAELRQEVLNTRQLAVLSLLRQSSPSDRLQGVSYSSGLIAADPSVMTALLNSLKYDPSPDVRLAALDVLTRRATLPGLQQALVGSFAYQTSPLLQVAMVDSFVETGDPAAHALLRKISHDNRYNKEVRERAAWGLAQPEWN